jgi:anti-sigma factor ChrR (cupin superfamily)
MSKAIHKAHRWDLAWKDDVDLFSLRNGVQVKVLYQDSEAGITDTLVKFPPGYTEPRHVHEGSHSVCVIEGLQIAEGEPMRPGDYVYGGPRQAHGPFDYPEGCIVFSSHRGPTQHRYPGSPAGEI